MNQSQLRTVLKSWLDGVVGVSHVSTIDFSADFITGNVIAGSINGTAFSTVQFDTNHALTLKKLAFSMQLIGHIRSARVTGARQITVTAYKTNLSLVAAITVTGGASQSVMTQTTTTAAASVPVFRANQKSEQYTDQCTFNILSEIVYGVDGYRNADPSTNLSLLVGSRIATIGLSFIGEKALEKAARVHSELYSERAKNFFAGYNLAVFGRLSIVDLTELMETDFQERADFDFRVRYFDTQEEDLGSIENANIDAVIDSFSVDQIIIG